MRFSIFCSRWSCGTTKEGTEATTQSVRATAVQTGGPELVSPERISPEMHQEVQLCAAVCAGWR